MLNRYSVQKDFEVYQSRIFVSGLSQKPATFASGTRLNVTRIGRARVQWPTLLLTGNARQTAKVTDDHLAELINWGVLVKL